MARLRARRTALSRGADAGTCNGCRAPVCVGHAVAAHDRLLPAAGLHGQHGARSRALRARARGHSPRRADDLTAPFVSGAQTALALALAHDSRFAILADGSPSCRSTFIYDGSFERRRHAGAGVTAALPRAHGIEVFADTEIDALDARLRQLSQAD
nr:DUF523 domain-containing protein [Burkholderia anthina]